MAGYPVQNLIDGLTDTLVNNSPYQTLAGQPMPNVMVAEMEAAMERLAHPIHQHIVSWWNEEGGGIFPDVMVKMSEIDPVSGYLGTKIDNDTIKYNPDTFKLFINRIPLASPDILGGVKVEENGLIYLQGEILMLRIDVSATLPGGNSMVPTSRAVKLYVDNAIQNIAVGGSGVGDMLKSFYDTNNNGVVDNSEMLDNQLPSYYLNWDNFSNIPSTFTPSSHTHGWADITSGKPTTLAGYGITDAEHYLGLPDSDGMVLSSLMDGTRSWVSPGSGGDMTYPGEGIPLSTGTEWGTSIVNNSANWDTAYGWGNHTGLYSDIDHDHTGDYEPPLGNPSVSGDILSSTTAGVRSWVSRLWDITGSTIHAINSLHSVKFNAYEVGSLEGVLGRVQNVSLLLQASGGLEATPNGRHLVLQAGNAYTTGNNNGGYVYIRRGSGNGSGSDGQIYMGTGGVGHLGAKGAETNVVYYDDTTGRLSYGSTPNGTPDGNTGELQYNDDGSFGASPNFKISGTSLIINNILKAPGSTEEGVDGTSLILKAGDAFADDSTSDPGAIYLAPGNPYNNGTVSGNAGWIYFGDPTYGKDTINLAAWGSNTNIQLNIQPKGIGSLVLGNSNTALISLQSTSRVLGTFQIVSSSSSTAHLRGSVEAVDRWVNYPTVPNSASNVAYLLDTSNVIDEENTRLLSVRNQGTETFGVSSEGLFADLEEKDTETEVVYYNPTTDKLSYGTAPGGGMTLAQILILQT